jgi:hypothetical protein
VVAFPREGSTFAAANKRLERNLAALQTPLPDLLSKKW